MDYLIICAVAAFASGLTFFSGFGLGTILLPAFALFFPTDIAVALTAVVHLLNNLFKLTLIGRHAVWGVVLRFGLPAILSAYLGAQLLIRLSDLPPIYTYTLGGTLHQVSPLNLIIALLMSGFAVVELLPVADRLAFRRSMLPLGGVLSGFFGGLSGHQGALRSAFLIKCGLSKEAFIGTGVTIACIIDVTRIFVYSSRYSLAASGDNTGLLIAATLSAFLGAFIGNRLLTKITLRTVRTSVAVMLFVIAAALGLGWV